MNPKISLSNAADDKMVNLQGNCAERTPEMSYLNHSQQQKPLRMEQVLPESRNSNMYQQNYQPFLQNNNPQYQKLQQNMYQTQQQQKYQQHQLNYQQQQNLRIPFNQNQTTPSPYSNNTNVSQLNNFQNNQRDPRVLSENEGVHMAPQIKPPYLQQLARPPLKNPNYSNIPHQTKAETSKLPNDRMQSNFPNVPQAEQAPQNQSVNVEKIPSNLELNSHRMSSSIQKPNEATIKSQAGTEPGNSNLKAEILPESLDDRSSVQIISFKSEAGESDILREKSKKTDLGRGTENNMNSSETGKKERTSKEQKNNIKDEDIIIGMVQKNIKFFEENDTTKKPLKPETPVPKSKLSSKRPPEAIKRVTYKNEDESGVDETPVIHPNLGSIFQVPRKVAKIPNLKKNKQLRKLKSQRLLINQSNKNPISNEYLKPKHVCIHYKKRNENQTNTQIYGSHEELLAFFENTKSWRKLNSHESKSNGNLKKEKVVHKATANGDISTPKQTPSKLQTPKRNLPVSPAKTPGSPGTPKAKSLPKTPESPAPPTPLIKKVPMNKIQVGAAPSPNLKTVKSKVGSLANTTHKPGGGNVKIESHKIDLSNIQPRTEAKNEQYKRAGGDKKIQQVKLQWTAKPKIGSLENATYKPGGGDKKIESVKLDFKEKAKPKVGSKDNVKHTPGGGNVKIENQKLEFKAQSKVGSLDNVKHKPGGGDIKIFDDKTYLRQVSGNSSEGRVSGTQSPLHTSVSKSFSETSQDGS